MRILFIVSIFMLFSCGKNTVNSSTSYNKVKFYLTEQEDLIHTYPVMKVVDLHSIIPDLDEHAVSDETYQLIYNSLKTYQNNYLFTRAVLVRSDDCSAPIGACQAYLVFK